MRRKFTHSVLGVALLAAVVAGAPTSVGAQAGWQGFELRETPTFVPTFGANSHPAWSAATTEDLAGTGVDLWVNNHAIRSEALLDFAGGAGLGLLFDNGSVSPLQNADTHGATFTDIDNDGDEDLVEVMGRNNSNRVFRNDGGTLNLIASPTGLEDTEGRGRQAFNVDYDGDGDMDLLVGNLDRAFLPDPENLVAAPSELYLNPGNGTAWTKAADPNDVLDEEEVRTFSMTSTGPGTDQVVIASNSYSIAGHAPDNFRTFALGGPTLAAAGTPVRPFAFDTEQAPNNVSFVRDVVLGDLDGDLEPEFVAARQDDFLGDPAQAGQLPLITGDISTKLTTSTIARPISTNALVDNCRAVTLADFDNDADLDIFAGCAFQQDSPAPQTSNVVLLNDGNGTFTIGAAALVPDTGANTATVSINADFNDDGWVDTYVGTGYDNEDGPDHIFLNEGGTSNHWLKIDLVGSNPDAMGAQVFVGTDKWQVRESGHRLHQGQDMKTLHFGLGSQVAIAPLEIMWPDGTFEKCTVAGVDRTVTITQGGNGCASQTKSGMLAALAEAPNTGPGPKLCRGRVVTVDLSLNQVATSGDDVILGTEGRDIINGLAGNDIICSLGGDDVISGGDGIDRIYAGDGRDSISGGAGRDRLFGGAGSDTMFGGLNRDIMVGNTGRDTISGEQGRDRINGATGDDIVSGGGGDDTLKGGLGVDSANGGRGTDSCRDFESRSRCES